MLQKSSLIFFILSVILILHSAKSQCTEGCIKCGLNPAGAAACELCDLFSSFYMDNTNACVRREIENCLVPSSDQKEYFCAQCKQGFMLDPANTKCVEVPSTKAVKNCRQYTLVGTCKQCFQHYYLEGNTCNRAGVIIENCRTYFGDDLCEECLDNFYFDVTTNKCVAFEPIENCMAHTFKACNTCRPGFAKNFNKSYLQELNSDFTQMYATMLWEGVNFEKNWLSTCVANTDEHCLEMDQTATSGKLTNSCKTCKIGFYLDNGKCLSNPGCAITNCETYATPELCKMCASTHYLDCNQCKIRATYADCSISNWTKDECFRCNDTHVLTTSGTCQARANGAIDQCTEYTRTLDTCKTCGIGFMLTNDRIACFAIIDNCTTYNLPVHKTDLKMTCNTCANLHYRTEDMLECNPQNVQFCQTYSDNSSNVCTQCKTNYYLDVTSKTCIRQNILNCASHTSNVNECNNCDALYWKENSTTCTALNITDCLANTTNNENCNRCEPHRYLRNNGTRHVCTAVIESLEVDRCDYNTGSDSKIGCSKCNSGNPLSLNNNHIIEMPFGCSKWNQTALRCTDCHANMDYTMDKSYNKTCTAAPSLTVPCLKNTGYYSLLLSDNYGTCSECRDLSTHYYNENICWQRNPIFNLHCRAFPDNKEECTICNEGYSAKESEVATGPKCLPNPSGFAAMTGCAIYNTWDPTKCVRCEWAYFLSPEGTCVANSSIPNFNYATNYYDHNTKSLGQWLNAVSGNATIINITSLGASLSMYNMTCKTGQTNYFFHKFTGYIFGDKGIFADNYFTDCEDSSHFVLKDDGNGNKISYVTEAECELAMKISNNLYCIKCKNNMNAKYTIAKYDSDGNDISSSNHPTVESCTPAADTLILTKKYKALGFRVDDNYINKEFFEEEIFYDTCPDVNHNLVVILSSATNLSGLFKKINSTVPEERSFCYDFGSTTIVENCYVYGVLHSSVLNHNYKTDTFQCISCKPGFKPTLTNGSDGRFINACTAIANCNITDPATNTWMNACEVCETGFVHLMRYTMGGTKAYLDISTCQSRTVSNCLIMKSSSECSLCEVGFTNESSGTQCTGVPAVDNCTKVAYKPEQMETISFFLTGFEKYAFSFASYVQGKFESISVYEGCSQCTPDHTLFGLPRNGGTFECVTNQSIIDANGPTPTLNCKYFSGTAANTCVECVSTHILDATDACVEKSTLDSTVYVDGCKILDSASTPKVCTTCKPGYELNTHTKECITLPNCTAYNQVSNTIVCTQCLDGKMVDYRDKTLCIDIIIPNCKRVTNGICVECKSGYTTIKVVKSFSGSKTVVYCMFNDLSNPTVNKFIDPKLSADVQFNLTSNSNTNLGFTSLSTTNPNHMVSNLSTHVFTQQICLGDFMEYCSIMNDNFTCKTCDITVSFKDPETEVCIPKTIPNCSTQNSLYVCLFCETGYFKNSLAQCEKQIVSDCETFHYDKPGCSQCNHGFYKVENNFPCYNDNNLTCTEYKCYRNTSENCTLMSVVANECVTCNDFYYLTNGTCHAHTVSGCKVYSSNSDACQSCHDRYYLDSPICKLNNAQNCKTYNLSAPMCSTCFTEADTTHLKNFKIDGNNCVPFDEIVGCKIYKLTGASSLGTCLECSSGYMLNNGSCVANPSGVCNCLVFLSPTVCARCQAEYFLDAATNTCLPVFKPIEHCADYTSLTECKLCNSGYTLNTAKTGCILITGVGCKEFATFDSCSSCEANLALIETAYMSSDGTNKIKECQSKITNCLDLVTVESSTDLTDSQGNTRSTKTYTHTCNKCSAGHVPSADKASCITSALINDCYDYTETGTCAICNDGYWLSKDKKTCTHDFQLSGYGCKDAYISETITCNRCKSGFMMDGTGACVTCGGTGCAVCSPESSAACALCGPGYYMTSSKTCSRNENFSFNLTKEEVAGGDPINIASNRLVNADEGQHEDGENFGMKLSAMILGMATLLVGLL